VISLPNSPPSVFQPAIHNIILLVCPPHSFLPQPGILRQNSVSSFSCFLFQARSQLLSSRIYPLPSPLFPHSSNFHVSTPYNNLDLHIIQQIFHITSNFVLGFLVRHLSKAPRVEFPAAMILAFCSQCFTVSLPDKQLHLLFPLFALPCGNVHSFRVFLLYCIPLLLFSWDYTLSHNSHRNLLFGLPTV